MGGRDGRGALVHVLALAACALTIGCAVPVVADLDDPDANRIVSALADQGIAAEKSDDPNATGRFRVEVPRAEAARAVSVMGEQGLPARKVPGMHEALDTGALVPSRSAEHERILLGRAGDLERTLGEIDGVVSARVHLAAPRRDPLSSTEAPATASVLVRYRGAKPPLSDADVQRLVTHAVPGLEESHVFVASVAAVSSPPHDLERFGPLTTDHQTARTLRLAVLGLALLGLALVACLFILWSRARKASRRSRSRLVPRAPSST